MANPGDAQILHLDEEIKSITEKIRTSEYRDQIELVASWAARPDDLLQELNIHRPHIVHISGHGNEYGEIVLLDKDGKAKPVSTQAIQSLFTSLRDNIRVVILNACYSKKQAEAITSVIDCVIGMSDRIEDNAAITFAASFYRAIGFGRSVEEAVDQAKIALMLEGVSGETVPELLVRNEIDPSKVYLLEAPQYEADTSVVKYNMPIVIRTLQGKFLKITDNLLALADPPLNSSMVFEIVSPTEPLSSIGNRPVCFGDNVSFRIPRETSFLSLEQYSRGFCKYGIYFGPSQIFSLLYVPHNLTTPPAYESLSENDRKEIRFGDYFKIAYHTTGLNAKILVDCLPDGRVRLESMGLSIPEDWKDRLKKVNQWNLYSFYDISKFNNLV